MVGKDTDGDGFFDSVDSCVKVPGVAPDGCPAPAGPVDTDGDGFMDPDDSCVTDPGTAPDGCPDSDGDGFKDPVDKCPQVAGVAPDGCPPPDKDGDGILDPNDQCIDVPETKNGYKDKDGCADEVPKAVAKFAGVIKGIYFDVDKDTIKPNSKTTLDAAVKVLKEFDDVHVEISGHTDSDGNREHNVDLSRRRADSVKKYLVDKGIAEGTVPANGPLPKMMGVQKGKTTKVTNLLVEGATVTVGNEAITAWNIPGHTQGSAAYLARGVLLGGYTSPRSTPRSAASSASAARYRRIAWAKIGRWPARRSGSPPSAAGRDSRACSAARGSPCGEARSARSGRRIATGCAVR